MKHPVQSETAKPGAELTAMRWTSAILFIAVILLLAPLVTPIVLAAWVADIVQPVAGWFEKRLHGRSRAAGSVVVLLVVFALLTVLGIGAGLLSSAQEFIVQIRAVLEGKGSLSQALLGGTSSSRIAWEELGGRYGANAWRAISIIAQASATVAVGGLVFLVGLNTFIVERSRIRAWVLANAPVPRGACERLAAAFYETGRGLLVAGGGTAIVQGAVATVAYFAVGIPRALLLGPLTGLCAIIPFVGSAIVWVPMAIELGITGQTGRAAVIVFVGVIVSTVDNVIRPFLARWGKLQLSTFGVLASMLGGIALCGASGAFLGPLALRLCFEALAILAEMRTSDSIKS
jgi:predicted PurR-regulated permease PerM